MASPLEDSTLVEQCSVIHSLLSEGEISANIYSPNDKTNGASYMNCENFYKWIETFKNS